VRVLSLALAALLISAPSLGAQLPSAERATDSGTPAWMTAWSPLQPIADHPRQLPRAPALPDLLVAPGPRIGTFWTVGNPAALPFQVTRSWSELQTGLAWDDGGYGRPMDGGDVDALQFAGLGWKPLGRGAAVGRLLVDQETLGRLPFAGAIEPHATSPLVFADSSVVRMRRLRARLEGAFGWRFAGWGVGLAAGVEVRDHETQEARFQRDGRMSTHGVAVGLLRELPFAGLRLAAHARLSGGDETMNVVPWPESGLIYQLEGYGEPARRRVELPWSYMRRAERGAWLWGLSAEGTLLGADWSVVWEHVNRDDEHFTGRFGEQPPDRWSASGWAVGGALQRSFSAGHLLLTGQARYSHLEGDAFRSDLEGAIFRGAESLFWGTADLRYTVPGTPWSVAAVFTLQRDSRWRRDYLVRVRSMIESWTPGGGLEVARSYGNSTAVSFGFAFASYSATALIPNPESMGPVYRLLIAPELSLYATQSRPAVASFGLRQRLGEGTRLLLRARWETAAPRGESTESFAPRGHRTLWNVSLALLLGQ